VPLKGGPPRRAPLSTPFLNHYTERVGAPFRKDCQAIVTRSGFHENKAIKMISDIL
jgi:hypothetical protein